MSLRYLMQFGLIIGLIVAYLVMGSFNDTQIDAESARDAMMQQRHIQQIEAKRKMIFNRLASQGTYMTGFKASE